MKVAEGCRRLQKLRAAVLLQRPLVARYIVLLRGAATAPNRRKRALSNPGKMDGSAQGAKT